MNQYTPIDEYIDNALPFAQPILLHILKLVRTVCPDAQEVLKWGMPHFVYKGKNLCHMAAFKAHCAFGLLNAELLSPQYTQFKRTPGEGMGHLGKVTALTDLPKDEIMKGALQETILLIDQGITKRKVKTKTASSKEVIVHPAFALALKDNKKALTRFDTFSTSCQWEYTDWINSAKTEPTLQQRIATTLQWLEEGKERHWKYKK